MIKCKNSNDKNKYYTILVFVITIFSVLSVFYFSWISSPRFTLNHFIPEWISQWADKPEHDNIRTAIPLFILGVLTSFFLVSNKSKPRAWFITWLLLATLVFLAELGQLMLPLRSFDWRDICWGALGAFISLALAYLIFIILILKKE